VEPGQWLKGKEKKEKWRKTKEMVWKAIDKGETRLGKLKGRCSKRGLWKKTKKKGKRQRQEDKWTGGCTVKGRGANTRSCKLGEERENRGGGRAFL
jgi:hypothetical protein